MLGGLEDEEDENSEMNRETFGAATMKEFEADFAGAAFFGSGGGGSGIPACTEAALESEENEADAFKSLEELESSILGGNTATKKHSKERRKLNVRPPSIWSSKASLRCSP